MKASAPYAVIGIGVILMATIAWWFGFREKEVETPTEEVVAPITVSEGLSIYTNGEHGFLVAYPDGAGLAETFESAHTPNTWRTNALPDAQGVPLLSITTFRTESDRAYPRFYETLVRLGMSREVKELAQCEKAQVAQGEEMLPDRVMGDTTWKAFFFADATMMKYVKGVSYRVQRGDTCYALETIASGSSYREDASSAESLSDEALAAEYQKLDTIIDSFRFVR